MQYSKPMIDLVYEIRRRVDVEMKPGIKLANPEMLRELVEFHHRCKDTITRTLIKELLTLAGGPWLDQLDASLAESDVPPQVSLENAPSGDASKPRKPLRIYRGRVVE